MKSWNEIRKVAAAFSKRWKNAYNEKTQARSFRKEFFAVFGVDTVVFNALEHRVKLTDGSQGYADCFWQGKILATNYLYRAEMLAYAIPSESYAVGENPLPGRDDVSYIAHPRRRPCRRT